MLTTRTHRSLFLCAICGIGMQKSSGRNVHEQNQHGFVRHEADETVEVVVRIRKSQLVHLFNVGTRLVEHQRSADHSSGMQDGADKFANDNDLQAIVVADPQGLKCRNAKNGVQKPDP
ncbi:hypothetical protein M3Y99_01303200 [Aphelenchoides fujianensis]|nr:hypothetical protein M3Y99_01303200 [Aphelenchoides fujianensis]